MNGDRIAERRRIAVDHPDRVEGARTADVGVEVLRVDPHDREDRDTGGVIAAPGAEHATVMEDAGHGAAQGEVGVRLDAAEGGSPDGAKKSSSVHASMATVRGRSSEMACANSSPRQMGEGPSRS